jgi:uncharacterized protein (TIGR02678 family)
MPEQRTDGHVTLLVAEYLARREQATLGELHAFVRQEAAHHATFWRKGVTEPGAEKDLLVIALDKLTALRLVKRDGDAVRSRPAIARFALDEPVIRETRKATANAASTLF